MSNPKLNKGTIIIVNEDFIIPVTGMTYYFYKSNKYKITTRLKKLQKLEKINE